jgi:hypothetical protein
LKFPLPSLTPPAAPPAISARKATQLCGQRAKLEDERLAHNRYAESLAKQVAAIDEKLFAFVAAEQTGPVRSVALKKWRLSIVAVARSLYYKMELEKEIGIAAVDQRRAALGTKDVLRVESI